MAVPGGDRLPWTVPRSLVSFSALASILALSGCGGSEEPAAAPASGTNSAATRNSYSFNLDTKRMNSRVTLNAAPVYNSAEMKQYEGRWMGLKVRFTERTSGSSELSIWNNNVAISSYKFASYRISEFGSKTTTSSGTSDQFSMYLSDNVTQVKYALAPCTVSP
jgi:hypothetical protein